MLQLQCLLGSPIVKQQQARLGSDNFLFSCCFLSVFSVHVDVIGAWAMSPRCNHINRSQVGRAKGQRLKVKGGSVKVMPGVATPIKPRSGSVSPLL